MYRLRDPHVVGERDMGTVDTGLDELIWGFFDHFMKGSGDFAQRQPKVRYFAMGSNRWHTADQWPPRGAQQRTLYFASERGANSIFGDGRLTAAPPPAARKDEFVYDPLNPVPTKGGNICCFGDELKSGAYDQRNIEARHDVLVYTSEPMIEALEVTGSIEAVLFVSSDAKDTDFTVKLVDVAPDGTAYNLDETIQRVRYRAGYDREVFMSPGTVYELRPTPLTTSNVFLPGHRIRVEVSSSDFPRFERNLNTGGRNVLETHPVVARNAVHLGANQASRIVLTVIPSPINGSASPSSSPNASRKKLP